MRLQARNAATSELNPPEPFATLPRSVMVGRLPLAALPLARPWWTGSFAQSLGDFARHARPVAVAPATTPGVAKGKGRYHSLPLSPWLPCLETQPLSARLCSWLPAPACPVFGQTFVNRAGCTKPWFHSPCSLPPLSKQPQCDITVNIHPFLQWFHTSSVCPIVILFLWRRHMANKVLHFKSFNLDRKVGNFKL